MSDIEIQRQVAAHDVAIKGIKDDISEIKTDVKQLVGEVRKLWPPGLAQALIVLSSLVTGLAVYLLTH